MMNYYNIIMNYNNFLDYKNQKAKLLTHVKGLTNFS